MAFIAYYRVSTSKQGESGLGLEAQQEAVKRYLKDDPESLIAEYTEVESGTKVYRPELEKAVEHAKREKATLIIAKLDRLYRSVYGISSLMNSGVQFVSLDAPFADKFNLHILAAVAEFEAERISERIKAALAAKRARGESLGNMDNLRKYGLKGHATMKKQANQFAANILPIIKELQDAGYTTLAEIAHILNMRGIKTARNGKWHPNTVKRVLERPI